MEKKKKAFKCPGCLIEWLGHYVKKMPCLCKLFEETSKGFILHMDSILTVVMEEKKTHNFKRINFKRRSCPKFLRVFSQCGVVSSLGRAERVYSRVLKIMFPLKLFIFKHSKIISHFKKCWPLFCILHFSMSTCVLCKRHGVSEPRAFGIN